MSGWAIDMLIATTALVALVLLIRRPVANLFGARAAYALWLAPALRLVMPPLPSAPAIIPLDVVKSVPHYFIVTRPVEDPAAISLGLILGIVWLGGALIYLLVHWARHDAFLSDAIAHGRPLDIDGVPYDVIASSRVQGPMATGLIHPMILVPRDFAERFTPKQQSFALLHEQLHHRRGDIWAAAAALVLTSLHWFNPLIHMAVGAFRRDMEAACDSSVLDKTGANAAPDYAQTILRCAAQPGPRSLCALTSIDELKGRLMMLKLNHGPMRRAVGLALASAIALGGLATVSVAHENAADEKVFEKKIVIRDVKGKDGAATAHADELPNCPGQTFEVNTGPAKTGAAKTEQSKFVLCAAKGESLLAALEKAEGDLQKSTDMPAEHKSEVLAKIRAKIAELRAKG